MLIAKPIEISPNWNHSPHKSTYFILYVHILGPELETCIMHNLKICLNCILQIICFEFGKYGGLV